jgi:predicted 3-demethylubiquinone-9 3-methyltransferase (glyoxalase superfamily)
MTNEITPCLWFDTEGEEAAELYTAVFPNSAQVRGPERRPDFKFNEAISLQVSCKNQDEVDAFWSKLSEGGEEGPCGWLKDRFGVSWQIVPTALLELLGDPDPEKSQRVTEAMLKMKKIQIDELYAAAAA